MIDHQRLIDVADHWITERSRTVIAAFLVLTLVFMSGFGAAGTESGTQQFTEDIPEQDAFVAIQDDFETTTFGGDTGSTQLIQRGSNVLSKTNIVRMLEAQHRLEQREGLDVATASSPARTVAATLAPNASTLEQQLRAVRRAPQSVVRRAAREALAGPRGPLMEVRLSRDLNVEEPSASAAIGSVTHDLSTTLTQGAGEGQSSPLQAIQLEAQRVVATVDGDIQVFGSGIFSAEFQTVIGDSLAIVVPAAVLLILTFLILAYRDPVDLVLGTVALVMAIIWTFGFMGIAGIPFTQMLIAVPPLLLAVGIDFGIHAINRYREERVRGAGIADGMKIATDQLLVAFFIVTTTTVIGFGANLTSALAPVRDFGVVAGIGIVFTFLIFGIFVPAAKVELDRLRERSGFPEFGNEPLGREGSALGRVLPVGVTVARRAPVAFLVLVAVASAGMAWHGTGVGTSFTNEEFLPPEENPAYLQSLPEPFRPNEYTVTATTNFLEETFATGENDQVQVYLEGPMRRGDALESIERAGLDPPDVVIADGRRADQQSIVNVIQDHADRSPSFRETVARHDADGDGIPDRNLGEVYDALFASPAGDRAGNYLTEDYRNSRVIYSVESDASQQEVVAAAESLADRHRFEATPTGLTVVFKAVSDVIAASAFRAMAIALLFTAILLMAIYRVVEGRAALGVANVVPIAVAIAFLMGTMRLYDVPFNAITGTILSIAIGLGVDYSAHMVHRFGDEWKQRDDVFDALDRSVRGTGGALTGSMLTTVTGIGVLVLAITPILGQFGMLVGLSILYSYLASLIVLPSALVVMDRYVSRPA